MRNYMQPQGTDHNNQNAQRNDGLAVTRNCKMGACKQKIVSYRVTTTTQVRVNYEKRIYDDALPIFFATQVVGNLHSARECVMEEWVTGATAAQRAHPKSGT